MQDNKPHTSLQHDMLSATPPLAIYLPPTVKRLVGNAAVGAKGPPRGTETTFNYAGPS
jgi:hypothetical protein